MIALVHPACPNPAALEKSNYKHRDNKEALRKSTSGKCMYCEAKIEHVGHFHVEHIKPKKKFPELEFVWENLGISCPCCNENKGDKYNEETPFINPYDENPEDHLDFFDFYIYSKNGSERGKYTELELDLNRSSLLDDRKERMIIIKRMIKAANITKNDLLRNQAMEEIKNEAKQDKEYSAMVKSLLIAQGIL